MLRERRASGADPAGTAFASLAESHRRAGELDRADALLEEGLSRLPDFATGHLIRARVLADGGDRSGARDAYHRVLELDPANTLALREAASLAGDRGDPSEALRLYQRLATVSGLDEELAGRIRELKRVRFGLETPAPPSEEPLEETLEDPVEEALEEPVEAPMEESVEEPFGETIDALFRAEGTPDGAEPVAEHADREPEPGVVTRTLGDLYARQGHTRRALDVYRKLVDRSPGDGSLRARMEELEAEIGGSAELDPTEELAREWGGPHEKQDIVTSPFTWGDDEAEEADESTEPPDDEGPSIASYFDDLLSGGASAEAREGGADATGAGGTEGRA